MSVTGVDTSLLIAALQSWHEQHVVALEAVDRLLGSEGETVLPVRALLEAYSVMTRLPPPHRLAPSTAFEVLRGTLERDVRLVGLPEEAHWKLLGGFVETGTTGGAVYDAEIIECCRRAGATKIVTLNRRDFERLAPDGVEIVTPPL